MLRKFNYTNRKKIPHENIGISINAIGENFFFNASIKKDGLEFPDNAKVYIEPFYGPDSLRFDFGLFSNIHQPENTDITELKQLSEKIYFHLKIVDNSENGLLLGDAKIYDLLNDRNPKNRSSILYVNPVKMDTKEIWRVKFTGEEGMPILEVNKDIEGIFEIAKNDLFFISLVYPSAIRYILEHIVAEQNDFDWIGDSWVSKWILFTRDVLNILDTPIDNSEADICDEWIDNVVREFCVRHRLFENYINKLNA